MLSAKLLGTGAGLVALWFLYKRSRGYTVLAVAADQVNPDTGEVVRSAPATALASFVEFFTLGGATDEVIVPDYIPLSTSDPKGL